MSWVESTVPQVDFIVEALQLRGDERILDLACGFGRHALELASRGHAVVGVDLTPAYIAEARRQALARGVEAEFICSDLRAVAFHDAFDVVLNLADGAIGYLEDDAENLKIFDLVASALKRGGKHLMEVSNAAYAARHFPRRHWEAGRRALSLAEFDWDPETRCMLYAGHTLRYGEVLSQPSQGMPSSTRLYTLAELQVIFQARGMEIQRAFGDYDTTVPASDDRMPLWVYSRKRL